MGYGLNWVVAGARDCRGRACAWLRALVGLLLVVGCAETRLGVPSRVSSSRGAPDLCDWDRVSQQYFGRDPVGESRYVNFDEMYSSVHAMALCQVREAPISSVRSARFLRCVWEDAFSAPVVLSLGDECVLLGRVGGEADGSGSVNEVRRPLGREDCLRRLDDAFSSLQQGPGRSELAEGEFAFDGGNLYYEHLKGDVIGAGFVRMPMVGNGSTGAVKACLLLRQAVEEVQGPQLR